MTTMFADGSDLPLFSGTPQEAIAIMPPADPRRSLDELERALRQAQLNQAQAAREVDVVIFHISDTGDNPSEAQLAQVEALIKRRTAAGVRLAALEWVLGRRAKLD